VRSFYLKFARAVGFLIFLCLFFPLDLFAQIQRELELDEAVKLAVDNNLNLRKNQIDLTASGYSEKNLWSEIFPTISASASLGFGSPLFSGDGFDLNENNIRYSAGVGISLGLNAGIPYLMNNIKLAHESNILRFEDARNLLSIQVTKKFYSLIAEKNNLLLLEEIFNLAQRHHERNEISFRNGLIRELTVIQSRLAVENARFSFSAANTAYANSMAEFLAMLGIAFDAKIDLLGEVNISKISADAEALIVKYLPGRPDIVRALQEIERLENVERQTVMQNRAPSLNLSLDWTTSKFDPFMDSFSGSARVNIPVDPWIPGTSRSQSIGRARDSIEKAKLDLTMTEDAAKNQIRSLSALLHNSWDNIEIARLSLEVAQRSYELTDQGFRNGTVEYLVVEDARNNMTNGRQRLLQSELSYFNMILDLCAALNISWNNLMQIYGASNE
jgi:multidrug efflux system outer membrane protein